MVVVKLVEIIAYINLKSCIAILGPSVRISQRAVTSPFQQEVDCLFSRFDNFMKLMLTKNFLSSFLELHFQLEYKYKLRSNKFSSALVSVGLGVA